MWFMQIPVLRFHVKMPLLSDSIVFDQTWRNLFHICSYQLFDFKVFKTSNSSEKQHVYIINSQVYSPVHPLLEGNKSIDPPMLEYCDLSLHNHQ